MTTDPPTDPGLTDGLVGPLNDMLARWLTASGVAAHVAHPWVVLPTHDATAQLKVAEAADTPNGKLVRLVGTLHAGGHVVVEPVLGIGATAQKAVEDAARSFGEYVLPPLLAGFFDVVVPGKVEVSEAVVGWVPRRVAVGSIGYWGRPPMLAERTPDLRWFTAFVAAVKAQPVPPGTHWVRLYYAQVDGNVTDLEATRDNADWPELREAMAAAPWPPAGGLFTARVFLVLRDAR